jgi:hypothetical protein
LGGAPFKFALFDINSTDLSKKAVKNSHEEKMNEGGAFHGILQAWKTQLEHIKVEVDRALLWALEGLECFGPISQWHARSLFGGGNHDASLF